MVADRPTPVVGAIKAVRVFTRDLTEARRFYAGALGLAEIFSGDGVAQYDTGQARLLVEEVDPGDPEAAALVGRFAGFSFTVENAEAACTALTEKDIRISAPPEAQPWDGVLAHIRDPDGNELTLVEYSERC